MPVLFCRTGIRAATSIITPTRWGEFTGKEWDGDVGLYHVGARPYDPYIGRFTSRDPAQDGINWYAYANNNPLAFIDPSGLRAVNETERGALIHTFGEEVGEYLASVIDIEIRDLDVAGRVPGGTKSKILLKRDYNYTKLSDLSVFIHEAPISGNGKQGYTKTREMAIISTRMDSYRHWISAVKNMLKPYKIGFLSRMVSRQ